MKSSDADDLGTGFVDPAMIARRDRVHLNIAQDLSYTLVGSG